MGQYPLTLDRVLIRVGARVPWGRRCRGRFAKVNLRNLWVDVYGGYGYRCLNILCIYDMGNNACKFYLI